MKRIREQDEDIEMLNDRLQNKSADSILASGILAYDAALDLKLNSDQLIQVREYFDNIVAKGPDFQVKVDVGFTAVCLTILTAEEKAAGRAAFEEKLGIKLQ